MGNIKTDLKRMMGILFDWFRMETKTGICEQVMTFVTPQSVGIS
jgi:hypothetical protein